MALRKEDQSFLDMLRDMRDRIDKLDSPQSSKVRKNDIRLSDVVVTANPDTMELCLENINSRKTVCIGEQVDGDPAQASWSFSGDLTGHTGEFSPPYIVERATTARQIVVAHNVNEPFTGTVIICVSFRDNGGDAISIRTDFTSGSPYYVVYEINVPLEENDDIHCELINAGTNAENISVHVRFGTPTVDLSITTCAF